MTSTQGRNIPDRNIALARKHEGEVIRLGPVRLDVLEDGSNTDNRIGAVSITIPAHTPGPPQHWHQMHDETFLVTAGEVTFTTRGEKMVLKQGDYLVVPPMAPHTFANESDAEAVMYNSFTPAYYVNYFRVLQQMAKENGGKLTPEIGAEVMMRYATLQTKKMGEDY